VRIRTLAALPAAALLALGVTAGLGAAPASADTGPTLAQATTVGIHNTYDQAAFPYLANALDTGTSMIELDVWDDVFTHEWKVSHDSLTSNSNNCVAATSASQLYTGGTNKDLEQCLDDVRLWLGAHPGHPPLTIKLELKAGFQNNLGLGPAVLDSSIRAHLGDLVFTPADLLAKPGGGTYGSLDEAARANNWPSRSALAGKVILEVIPGTVEQSNPTDTLWTDVEYAQYLRGLAAAGTLSQAQVFPSVLGAASGDPRARYSDTTLRPWFVVFDGDAATYANGIDTSWYDTNHYYLIMTDAQNVSPALSDTSPTLQQAQDRVALLATKHASVVSCDWTGLPQVLGEVLPRG
jgi:hypothetical protein